MNLIIGQSYLKLDIHNRFGGNPRAGICPTATGPVLVFSDPVAGERFGYAENDEVSSGVYRYTGEGQTGDQQLVRGNKAIFSGRQLLLFAREDQKSWVYVGEIELDTKPFEIAISPDRTGSMRQVLVFRFVEKVADFKLLTRNVN